MKIYVGIDNGVTGSIGVVPDEGPAQYHRMPVKKEQSYTKKKQSISRVLAPTLTDILAQIEGDPMSGNYGHEIRCFIERPFYNPHGLKATVSGMRCLEAVLIVVESLGWSYQYVESRDWQKPMLPRGLKGSAELKAGSLDIGVRRWPYLEETIRKIGDADGLLMAEWARINRL